MTPVRPGRGIVRERAATVVLCALAIAAGQLVGGAGSAEPGPPTPGPAGGSGAPAAAARPALAADLDRHVAPEQRRTAARPPATAAASAAGEASAAGTPDATQGAGGTGPCGDATGTCDGVSIPPPPDSDVAAAVRSTGSGVLDYPGRYQVDPDTGQVVDTGSASVPTEPVDVVAVTTTVPPPTTTAAPPATAQDLGSDAGAPVG
ncbi:MAG TPA: hypothetical protein VFZ77_00085 [Acidimicrobiales bacterium]